MTTEVSKTCPECAPDRLVVRTNGDTGVDFLGCENWPKCKHTEPLPLGYGDATGWPRHAAGVGWIMKWFLFSLCYLVTLTFAPFLFLPPVWGTTTFVLGLIGIFTLAAMLEDWGVV